MGTSSSGTGPKGKSPLLPSWVDNDDIQTDNESNDEQDVDSNDEQDVDSNEDNDSINNHESLVGSRSSLTNSINKGGGKTLFNRAVKNYIRKLGGYKNASKSAAAGVKTGVNYVNFLGNVSSKGFNQTLIDYNLLDCVGKSMEFVFARIADIIAPNGSTNDDSIARVAIMIAMNKLYEKLFDEDVSFDVLENLDSKMLKDTVIEFVSAYIFKKYVYEVGLSLEKNNLTEREAVELEGEMSVFIRSEVERGLKKESITKIDFSKGKGQELIESIFDIAYSTLEK